MYVPEPFNLAQPLLTICISSCSHQHPHICCVALHLTFVFHYLVQQIDAMEMFGGGDRQGHDISNSLMETRVGPVAEGDRLVLVLQEVLDVAHLMMHCDEVIHVHHGALLDPGDTGVGGEGREELA